MLQNEEQGSGLVENVGKELQNESLPSAKGSNNLSALLMDF